MHQWRPQSIIRLKSLGLNWRAGKVLAAEIYDDAGRIKGVRPLGGSVEFGETVETALIREFKEELDLEITITSQPVFMENIYTHEGVAGHEILAIFDVAFPAGTFEDEERIQFYEDNGQACFAEWYDLAQLDCPGCPELYPTGLKTHLMGLRK